jgi:hypothetical protein
MKRVIQRVIHVQMIRGGGSGGGGEVGEGNASGNSSLFIFSISSLITLITTLEPITLMTPSLDNRGGSEDTYPLHPLCI